MQRIPAVQGELGETVTGNPIPYRKVTDVDFAPHLKRSEPCPDDPLFLQATVAGRPIQVERGVHIDTVYTVKRVNMATGNVIFDGTVHVKGEVHSGMTVRASGDIIVEETVEDATLEAGGNIVVHGGIIGALLDNRKEDERAYVKCQGSVNAQFAQGIRIEAGDTILINDSVVQCELYAGKQVSVGQRGKGIIVGGHVYAELHVRAKILGSHNGTKTCIRVGHKPELEAELKKLTLDLQAFEHKFESLTNGLMAKNSTTTPKDTMQKTLAILLQAMTQLREKKQTLQEQLAVLQEASIHAEQRIYAGVDLQLGGKQLRIMNEQGSGHFVLGKLA